MEEVPLEVEEDLMTPLPVVEVNLSLRTSFLGICMGHVKPQQGTLVDQKLPRQACHSSACTPRSHETKCALSFCCSDSCMLIT